MSMNPLRSFFRKREQAGLVEQFIAAENACIWVEDTDGALLFGSPGPASPVSVPVMGYGVVLGYVKGCEKALLLASWLGHCARQEEGKKKLGTEVLNLYREINLMFGFSEKLASAVGLEAIARLTLEEAGRLIYFKGGVITLGEKAGILAKKGVAVTIPELGGKKQPEIMSIDEKNAFLICAPLKVEQRLLGWLVVQLEEESEKTASNLKFLNTLALQAASAIENALQYEEASKKALELEREQIDKHNIKELDELKSRFYANITHEFRTPLAIIQGMASPSAERSSISLEERFELIRKNGADLLRLVDQLLELSVLEAQSIPLQLTRGDIVLFLRQMVESFRIHAMEKEISFDFQSFKEGVLMDFDPDKLQKAVGNLLSNAIKYTPPGGRILLAVQWTQYPAGQLLLTVSDTGIGIPEEELPFIFDRYYQGPKAHPGSGVGLAHARELASLMGGDISVKSEFGRGATFSLWLPLAKKDLLSKGEIAGVKNEVPLLLEKPLLLIIEDNPDLVRYLQTALESSYEIEVEMDGGAGLSRARQIVPDIVLSDIMMPGADGYEVCEALKADERTSHIPVILLTAKTDARSRIDGLRRGADAYLGKPFEMEELMACLENLLESRRRLQARYGLVALSKAPSAGEEEDAFIEKVKTILEEHLSDEKFALPELCREVGMSRSQLFRKMKALVNDAPSSFIRMYRLHRAKELLETSGLQVSEIAYRVGYRDPAYFSFAFHEAFGITPSLARH